MMNPFKYTFDNKRYHTLAYENRIRGRKEFKAVIDAGFTCPNIDGTKGRGGCIYCSGGSGYFTASPEISVRRQVELERERILKKHPDADICAYFQAHTNTYAPVSRLRALYEEALTVPGVSSISVATRPDSVSGEALELLTELSSKTRLSVELGLQTVHDETAEKINRCYDYAVFLKCYEMLKLRGICVGIHLINGLPGENEEMMTASAKEVGQLRPDSLKIHLLHVIQGTMLEKMYLNGEYSPMSLESYTDIVVSQLELIPPETVIERLTGDGNKNTLISPLWSRDKIRVLGTIDKKYAQRDTWQGKRLKNQ